jgi:hypothetical protein
MRDMPKLFPGLYVGNMYLNNGGFDGGNGIANRY